MSKTNEELVKSYRERIRRQNKAIQDNYDRVSAAVPKGTIDRIRALGLTVNGAINASLIVYLERAEEESGTEPKEETQTATISPAKEEREEIINTPTKAANRADKKPFDIYALQAELDARKKEVEAHKDSREKTEEVPESVEDIPDESGESDELTDRLNVMKAYRKQVVEEREKYGEASYDLIKDFIEKVEKEGEDITSPEYQERIREAIGAVNLDRINEYLKSIGKI